ncbi:MAG: MerC family mercury resistance protein [Gammaproteobacteria bacterium]|nr:MerC family mercury resistance protein [Gammaproteobacteria bacterium]
MQPKGCLPGRTNFMNPSSVPLCPAEPRSARLDLYAAGLSMLCLLHCLALPLLVTLIPLAAQAAESELAHRILAVAAVPLSLRVVWKTLSAGGNRVFVGAALTGLGLLLLAAFIEAVSAYEEPITVVGGVLLCSAHVWHWMQQRGKSELHGLLVEADET